MDTTDPFHTLRTFKVRESKKAQSMNLDNIDGAPNPGLDPSRVDPAVASLLAILPESYRHLLTLADGIALASGARIYSSNEILERNATFEVAAYLPGHVAIGDDGGGHLFVLRTEPSSPVMCIGAGALGSAPPDILAEGVETWISLGCPAEILSDARTEDWPEFVNIYLDKMPEDKLAGILAIKKELGLDISISQLKTLTETLPARIATNVPYGKFRKRCDALNTRLSRCLSVRID